MSTIDNLNLINTSTLTSVKPVTTTSAVATNGNRQAVADSGKKLPVDKAAGVISEDQKREISKAAKDVSGYIQNITRELNFSIDEDLERTVITVIDEQTGDVIRQIPTEEILVMAKSLAQVKDKPSKGLLFQGDA